MGLGRPSPFGCKRYLHCVISLAFANHLKDWLNKDNAKAGGGTWKVVMTHIGDQTVSISTRAAICNNAGAGRWPRGCCTACNRATATPSTHPDAVASYPICRPT